MDKEMRGFVGKLAHLVLEAEESHTRLCASYGSRKAGRGLDLSPENPRIQESVMQLLFYTEGPGAWKLGARTVLSKNRMWAAVPAQEKGLNLHYFCLSCSIKVLNKLDDTCPFWASTLPLLICPFQYSKALTNISTNNALPLSLTSVKLAPKVNYHQGGRLVDKLRIVLKHQHKYECQEQQVRYGHRPQISATCIISNRNWAPAVFVDYILENDIFHTPKWIILLDCLTVDCFM